MNKPCTEEGNLSPQTKDNHYLSPTSKRRSKSKESFFLSIKYSFVLKIKHRDTWLAQPGEYATLSQGCEFKLHVGYKGNLKKKNNKI